MQDRSPSNRELEERERVSFVQVYAFASHRLLSFRQAFTTFSSHACRGWISLVLYDGLATAHHFYTFKKVGYLWEVSVEYVDFFL